MKDLTLPVQPARLLELEAGEKVTLTGYIYTARDAAHMRMLDCLEAGGALPIDLINQAIYYVGPAPAKDGEIIGPAGPTTSGRMDAFTPALIENGLKIMIGKGRRSPKVIEAIKNGGAVYLAAIGGAAALMMASVRSVEVVAYEDLGTEAMRKLYVEKMPLIVAVDSNGHDFYDLGPRRYLNESRG